MKLNDVHKDIHRNKAKKRIGRGPGSGHGKTSTRGSKGQGSRSGYVSNFTASVILTAAFLSTALLLYLCGAFGN